MSKYIVVLIAYLNMGITVALAQEAASVVGTVTDPSAAVVAGAKITATNLDTNLKREVSTSAGGDYSFPNLPVGSYKITAEMSGFKMGVANGVKLDVNRAVRVDFALQVGAENQRVNVTSTAPLLQTNDSQVGTLIENQRIIDLPLNGRNFTQLSLLVPGAVEGVPGDYVETYSLNTRGTGVSFSVNGQAAMYNEYLLDGVPIKEVQHEGPALSPSVDSLQEFRVQTSNYDAEFGTEAGGQINLVTKSGTNSIRGDVYEFLRNDALDARNFFDTGKAELRQNQFGGTLGGPIKRDKTFFFFSYEGLRIRKGYDQLGLVPNATERGGDFSDLPDIPVINPNTGQPFMGNQIPMGMQSSYSTQILQKFVPLPNNPGNPVFNWISQSPNSIVNDQYLARLDHRFSQNDSIYGRFILENVDNISPKLFPTDHFTQDSRGQNWAMNYTHTFSGNKLNEVKAAYNRHRETELVGEAFKENVGQELGLQGICEDPACWGIPDNYVGPFLDFGEHGLGQTVSGPRAWLNEIFYLDDTFYWTKGTHMIRFGTEFNRNHDTFLEAIFPRGQFSFTGQFTSPDGSPNESTALADFLLGLPFSSEASISIFNPYFRASAIYPWFQDDWRVTPDLTLNLGLSYWWFGRPQSKDNTIANVDFSANPVQLVTPADASQFGLPRALMNNDNNNFSPRIGFAYSPHNLKRLVVRGGYGIFYQRASANNWIDIAINPPFVTQTDYILDPSAISTFNIDTIFTQTQPIPLLVFGMDSNWRDAYVQEWNFTTQYQPTTNTTFSIGYLGNKGTKLPSPIGGYDVNQAVPGTGSIQSRRIWSNFGTINYIDDSIESTYESLQAEMRHQFSSGLSFLAAYTYSKCLDDDGWQNILDRSVKGLCDIDSRQRFVISYIYDLPFGPGKLFLSGVSGPVKQLVAGWQVNGITTFASGQPLTAYMPGDWANVGGSAYPDLVANPNLSGSTRSPSMYFNTAAFAAPPAGSFGTSGRNNIIGPGINDFDFSLMKNFSITEHNRLEFRAELFNIFNHANFLGPGIDTTFSDPTFGVVSSARDGREIQFGLKFMF